MSEPLISIHSPYRRLEDMTCEDCGEPMDVSVWWCFYYASFANRHKRKDWPMVRSLIHTRDAMHDTDKGPGPEMQPNQPTQLVTTKMGFQHPPGFEPAAFMIIGMTKDGRPFINMPQDQPHLCLHLATLALAEASKLAVLTMQNALVEKSPIIAVPPGMQIPPFQGPAGRG